LDLVLHQLLAVCDLRCRSWPNGHFRWQPVALLVDLHLAADGIGHKLDVLTTLADQCTDPRGINCDLLCW